MRWSRQNDSDPSPLHVFGRPVEDSMFNPGGSDFSPNESRHFYDGKPGDTITMTLDGNLVADAMFDYKKLPAQQTSLDFPNSRGRVSVSLK